MTYLHSAQRMRRAQFVGLKSLIQSQCLGCQLHSLAEFARCARLNKFSHIHRTMATTSRDDYSKWSNEQLVARVTQLEDELEEKTSRYAQNAWKLKPLF